MTKPDRFCTLNTTNEPLDTGPAETKQKVVPMVMVTLPLHVIVRLLKQIFRR